jgi:membrane protease YdiL (CAAX protease family)
MPSVLAVVFTGITKGKNGIKELLSRLIAWRVNPFWYVFVLIFNFLVMYLPYLICNLFGGSFRLTVNTRLLMPLYFLIAIVFWGPLGEEIGWRGYVQPGLRQKLSLFPTGLIIGAVWGLWHLPLFFIPGSSQYGSSFLSFLISDIALGVVFAWVYERTGGSLLISCLFHAAWNFTNALITVRSADADTANYLLISNIIYVVLLICIVIDMYRKKKESTVKIQAAPESERQ